MRPASIHGSGRRAGRGADQLFAGISSTVNTGWQWPPFLDQAVTDWTSTIGKALAGLPLVGSERHVALAVSHQKQTKRAPTPP